MYKITLCHNLEDHNQHSFIEYWNEGWCVTWSLILREKHRLRVFENRVLRRIVVPMSDEIIAGWRKVHDEELRNFYSSPNIVIKIQSRA
jgi:hypothetical protein